MSFARISKGSALFHRALMMLNVRAGFIVKQKVKLEAEVTERSDVASISLAVKSVLI